MHRSNRLSPRAKGREVKILLSQIKGKEPKREHGSIADLKASIADVGLINPLTIDDNGNLLAGRRRYQAISELGWKEVEVTVLPVNGDQVMAMAVAIDENKRRKDLTEVEEAIANAELEELKRKQYGEKKRGRPAVNSPKFGELWTQDKTAELLNVSRQKVGRDIQIASAIKEYPALAKETKGQAVLAGYKRQKETEALLEIKALPQTDRYRLYCGNFRKLYRELEPESVDCIITDPPYAGDALSLYSDLAKIASYLLKPNKSLLVISGLMYLPQLLNSLGEYLSYQWVISFQMGSGTARVWNRKVCQVWKPILWFVKGQYDGEWITDFIRSKDIEKGLDDWQQPEAVTTKLVSFFTKPDDVILDPMMGTGTSGVSTITNGRRFIGYELDQSRFDVARGRLSNVFS